MITITSFLALTGRRSGIGNSCGARLFGALVVGFLLNRRDSIGVFVVDRRELAALANYLSASGMSRTVLGPSGCSRSRGRGRGAAKKGMENGRVETGTRCYAKSGGGEEVGSRYSLLDIRPLG